MSALLAELAAAHALINGQRTREAAGIISEALPRAVRSANPTALAWAHYLAAEVAPDTEPDRAAALDTGSDPTRTANLDHARRALADAAAAGTEPPVAGHRSDDRRPARWVTVDVALRSGVWADDVRYGPGHYGFSHLRGRGVRQRPSHRRTGRRPGPEER